MVCVDVSRQNVGSQYFDCAMIHDYSLYACVRNLGFDVATEEAMNDSPGTSGRPSGSGSLLRGACGDVVDSAEEVSRSAFHHSLRHVSAYVQLTSSPTHTPF